MALTRDLDISIKKPEEYKNILDESIAKWHDSFNYRVWCLHDASDLLQNKRLRGKWSHDDMAGNIAHTLNIIQSDKRPEVTEPGYKYMMHAVVTESPVHILGTKDALSTLDTILDKVAKDPYPMPRRMNYQEMVWTQVREAPENNQYTLSDRLNHMLDVTSQDKYQQARLRTMQAMLGTFTKESAQKKLSIPQMSALVKRMAKHNKFEKSLRTDTDQREYTTSDLDTDLKKTRYYLKKMKLATETGQDITVTMPGPNGPYQTLAPANFEKQRDMDLKKLNLA